MNKRLLEIEARKNELRKELEGEVTEERMAEIEKEVGELETEETELRKKTELRSRLGEVVDKTTEGQPEDPEQRAMEQAKETGKVSISVGEVRGSLKRSITIETDSLAKPTKVGTDIKDNLEVPSSIADMVEVIDLTGCNGYEEPYEKTDSTAGTRTDGSANDSTSDPVFRVAKLNPYLLNVTSYVSKNIARLTPVGYVEKVKKIALKALKTKLVDCIVNGVSGSFLGIKIAQNTKDEAIYKTYSVTSNSIGQTTLRDIVFQYGGDDALGGNCVLLLTKEDLAAFGAVRGTNEKKAVYEITPDAGNPNVGTIKDGGTIVKYCLCSKLTSLSSSVRGAAAIQTMVYGDPKNFELGLFGPYTIEVSKDYKFAEGLLTIMGEAMVGGNIIVNEGFVVVTLAATE